MAGKLSFGEVQISSQIPLGGLYGTYIFVDSVNGSDGNSGKKPGQAVGTLAQAIVLATAGLGDVIVIAPGHAEAVTATNLNLSKSHVKVVGLGNGTSRPKFTYGAAAATITVSAAGCSIDNCYFLANFLDVASAFTIGAAANFHVTNSLFVDTSAILNFLCCVTTGSTNNAADGLAFNNNVVQSLPATDGAVVSVLGNLAGLSVCDNFVDKLATSDAGHLCTFSSKVVTRARILRNYLSMQALASQSTGTLITGSSTTSSGIVAQNFVYQIDTSTGLLATTGQKFGYLENYVSGAADKSGTLFPAADDPA